MPHGSSTDGADRAVGHGREKACVAPAPGRAAQSGRRSVPGRHSGIPRVLDPARVRRWLRGAGPWELRDPSRPWVPVPPCSPRGLQARNRGLGWDCHPAGVRAHQESQGQAVSAQPHSAAAGTLHGPRIQQAFNRWCLTFKRAFNSSSSRSSVDAHGVLTGAPWLHPLTPLGLFCLLCMDPWAAMVSPTQLRAL